MTLNLRYAALSDVGRVRKDNQDSGFASERLLVIADGVGGAARGDIASSTAVHILRRLDAPTSEDLLEALAGAIHRAHDRIAELVEEDPEIEGTSTTVTAALFDGARMGVGHVGDSRGYLLRDGELSQLTRDHTFVQGLIDEGRITEEEARTHPHRNLILRAVDGVHETEPDLFLVELAPGDRVLLCSDGCSGVLDNRRLVDILGTGTVDYAAVELIRASLDAGSSDNVTCVVADVYDADAAPDPVSTPVSTPGADPGPDPGPDPGTLASATTGPMLVGAAAEQTRPGGASVASTFRGHRKGDTGELEPVVDGDRGAADPEVLRYAPRAPRRFAWLRRVVILLVVGGVLALIATGGYRWTQNQFYVAGHGDRVAIYRGVLVDVPGLSLTSVYQDSSVTLASLSDFRASSVRGGIVADDLDHAHDIVANLGELARVCPSPSPTPSPSPSRQPSPSPSRQPSPAPGGGSSGNTEPASPASPTGTRSAPSPTPTPAPTPSLGPGRTLAPPDCVEAAP